MQSDEESQTNLSDLSSFPFISEASEYVGRRYKLDDLIGSRVYESARKRGKERVSQAIEGEIAEANIRRLDERVNREMELLSYPFARILVSCVNDDYLTRRYALAEAKLAHLRMLKKSPDFLMKLSGEFNLDAYAYEDDSQFKLYFADYVKLSSGIRDSKWKLVNRMMDHGWVEVSKDDFARLLQEAIRTKILTALPLDLPEGFCRSMDRYLTEVKSELKEVKSRFETEGFGEVKSERFPPCITHLIGDVKSGVNLPHTARFALTSFLLSIGMSVEEVIKLYASSPDFNEDKTRYQVVHISGSSGTKYTPPSCSTMETYGNCHDKDKLCQKVSHPLSYYKVKMGS
ncbi:MAG: DNA primase regulatory subunit PriL [Halobacteriota archaeon]|nr:DNA primase regulatory subunit PriL [Halobacteriota archaeon]